MDPRIALNPSIGAALLSALRTQSGDAQVQTLLALVGESVDLLLLSTEGSTVKLQLPSGQAIEAEGDLPYPPGTRLTVQVLPPASGQSAPRLKLVEAVPPPPVPILAPLQQGEARQLLARLSAPETPPELIALARLFVALGTGSEAPRPDARVVATSPEPAPRGGSSSQSVAPPPAGRIVAMLRELPPAVLRDLQRALFPAARTPPSLAEVAEALRVLGEAIVGDQPILELGVPSAHDSTVLTKSVNPLPAPAAKAASMVPKETPAKQGAAGAAAPAEEAVKLLRSLQETLFSPALPTGAADPALEPLKNLLLILLKPTLLADRQTAADSAAAAVATVPESGLAAQAPAEGAPAPTAPTVLPTTGRIVALLRELPPAVLQEFQRIVFAGGPPSHSLSELADALRGLLQSLEPPPTGPRPAAEPGSPSLSTARQVLGEAALADVLLGVQAALAMPVQALPSFVFQGGDPAMEPLKNLLLFLLRPSFQEGSAGPTLADLVAKAVQTSEEAPAMSRGGVAEPTAPKPGQILDSGRKHAVIAGRPVEATLGPEASSRTSAAPKPAERLPDLRLGSTAAANQAATEPPAAVAKSWESWLSAGVRTLSDPMASPREAPFHLAQAKEGTAFFELPLPWDGQGKVVQLWVESDADGRSRGNGKRTRRVLVGLHFSALGETRVGIVASGERLQVRVWTEHPELLKAREAAIRADLEDLGPELDWQVLALGEPGESIPSLRALADGTGFHALG